MTTTTIFAANWKMHVGPSEAREFLREFLSRHRRAPGKEIWLFPPAVSIEAVAELVADHPDIVAGAQNIHWEPKGAYTGEISVGMARDTGAGAALVGHSERRHVFGETDEETGKKVRALLDGGLTPVLCVGEKLEEREADRTRDVVQRQLDALDGLETDALRRLVIAYEPVWAIGTGRTATPADAAIVHREIRDWFAGRDVTPSDVRVLYGGSVKPSNAAELLSDPDIDGVLVGGASLNPVSWGEICNALD